MKVQSYLFFNGKCEEALAFYRKALGAEITMMMRFKETPEPRTGGSPGDAEKIMHADFRIGETLLMASDGMPITGQPEFKGITLSIEVADDAEARRVFDALCEGGQAKMPLAKTFWSSSSGMLTDRFGVSWMVNVGSEAPNKSA